MKRTYQHNGVNSSFMGIIWNRDPYKEGFKLIFPYGEWVILFLAILTWVEQRASRRFFLTLTIAWLIGRVIEAVFPSNLPWHWHYARLAVMMIFWIWVMQRTKRWIYPLLFTSFILSVETLFLVNDPGVVPYGPWLFNGGLLLVAWLTSKSDWGIAAALVGSWILNQALVRFTYEGIVRHADLPDPFVWNFGVGLFTIWAGLRQVYQYYTKRIMLRTNAELIPVNSIGSYEPAEEREL